MSTSSRALPAETPLLKRLNEQRIAAAHKRKAFLERAAEGETLTDTEQREFEHVSREIDRFGGLIKEEIERVKRDDELAQAYGSGVQRFATRNNAEARYGSPLGNARLTGLPNVQSRSFNEFGHWFLEREGFEARAANEGTGSAGGHLVPIEYSAPILDLAVNAMQVRAAGATVVPMNSRTLVKAVQTSDPTPAWRAESAAIVSSDPVFAQITFAAKTLSVHTAVTRELLEDADPDFGNVLATSMARAFALELDRVALYGTGASNQPLGLKPNLVANASSQVTNFTGVNGGTLASGTAAPALAGAISRVKGRNYTPTGQLYSSRTEAQLGSLLEGTANQPLRMPEYVTDVPTFVTNQIPNNITVGTSNDTSDYFVGDWSNLMIGLRTQFEITRHNDPLMLSNGQIAFVGWLRADVQVARLGAFEVLAGLRA